MVAALLLALFAATIPLRAPWRGHLAPGDSWVTGQTLRFVRTWQRDGALDSGLALVLTPPTADYRLDPERKWGVPGHPLLVLALLSPLGVEASVESLMRINLGLHALLALLLALLAYALARGHVRARWARRPAWAGLVALHCGAFALLLPALLYWGQNLSAQVFTAVPLLVWLVGARWLRGQLPPGGPRRAVDASVAAVVCAGVLTDFLFWLLVPYLLLVRALRAWRGRERTDDPWLWTLALPYALGMAALGLLFWHNGQLATAAERGAGWTTLGAGPGGGVVVLLVHRSFAFLAFFWKYYWGAYGVVGLVCLLLAALQLLPRRSEGALSPAGRGVLLDLVAPCLLFVFALAPHQATHSFSPMKFAPFVALVWTVLAPVLLVRGGRVRCVALGAAYAVAAVWVLAPATSGYARYFPEPDHGWEAEGAFLREHTRPDDSVFSPATEIRILPPQRIALAERTVLHVYGPLDVYHHVMHRPDRTDLAIYGPPELAAALGAGDAEPTRRGERSVTRFDRDSFLHFLFGRQPYAGLLFLGAEVDAGAFRSAGSARQPLDDAPPAPPLPAGFQLRFGGARGPTKRLYWSDARRFHWITDRWESVTLGDRTVKRGVAQNLAARWNEVDEPDEEPLGWGALLTGLFAAGGARDGAERFSWRDHDVIRIPLDPAPAPLRAWAPDVADWEAYLFYAGETPVGLTLEPREDAPGAAAHRVSAVLEPLLRDILVPSYVPPQWRVLKRPERGHSETR